MKRLLLVGAILFASCRSPRPSIDGVWVSSAPSIDRQSVFYMVLGSDGEDISGYACRVANDFRGVILRDLPVRGEYPWVGFTRDLPSISTDAKEIFLGRVRRGDSGEILIAGTVRRTYETFTYELHFRQTQSAAAPSGCR